MNQSITKIDLHLHSNISRKIGDVIGWNSIVNTLYKIRNNDIKVISFTDHDHFSANFYNDVKKEIKKNNLSMIVLPGVEITVRSSNKNQRGHALFIFNNNISNINNLEEITNEIRNKYIDGIKLVKAVEMYKNYEFVIIPHIGKGSDNLLWDDLKDVGGYIHNVESKPNNFLLNKFYKDSKQYNMQRILFSDCHDWIQMKNFKWCGAYIYGEFEFNKIKGGVKQYDKLH